MGASAAMPPGLPKGGLAQCPDSHTYLFPLPKARFRLHNSGPPLALTQWSVQGSVTPDCALSDRYLKGP